MGLVRRPTPARLTEKLLQIRETLGLSQAAMVEYLGLPEPPYERSTISAYERGDREPPLTILLAYARGVGITTDLLIDDDLDLPTELPVKESGQRGRRERKTDRGPAKSGGPAKAATLTLRLDIASNDNSTRAERRARKQIEGSHLKPYKPKMVGESEYELIFSYQDDADLNQQVYGLLNKIADAAAKQNCSTRINVQEKGTERRW